jgi:hypothetical protein
MDNKWIPISERLPDVHKRYLVSMKHKSLNDTLIDCRYYDPDYQFEYQDSLERHNWEVIAWQNLPKPYKELATDNNVVTKSGKDNNAKDADLSPEEAQELKAERDYLEREAVSDKSKLGLLRLWFGSKGMDMDNALEEISKQVK